MGETLSRQEREKLRHRREILAVALKLFSDKGYHNVSMHEIAASAEFSIGSLYKFFKNKEDLYRSLMMEKGEGIIQILNDVLSQDEDVVTIIRNYIAAKAGIITNNIEIFRLHFAETQGASYNIKAGLEQKMRNYHRETIKKLACVLEKGIRAKALRQADPFYLAAALDGLTNAFLFCWLENPDQHPYEANVTLITELFLKGALE
ncbi:MAG: TetR/AcrR family transcriptional regulator [bacterium]|nr:TetR/AcrR family transcriptional regulator [Candidatus Sumerlaeota bacterium]